MYLFKKNIFKSSRPEEVPPPQLECLTYVVTSSASTGQYYSYEDCEGVSMEGYIGGSGGFDQQTFCAKEGTVVITGSETTLSEEGLCSSTSITITNVSGYVEPCGPGLDARIVTSSILLSDPVTVDTHFIIRTTYSLSGNCTYPEGSIDTYIDLLAGQSSGDSVGCSGGAPAFVADANAATCTTFVVGSDNFVDNIIIP